MAHGWKPYESHLYKYFRDNSQTHVSAAASCKNKGSLMVSLNSKGEQDFIEDEFLMRSNHQIFIGGNDIEKG